MRTKTKIWLIIAASLVVAGLIMFSVLMSLNGWDFTKLNTSKFETNTFNISEQFSKIAIDTDTSDILLIPSRDNGCRVICYESEKVWHSVCVEDDSLIIKVVDERKWYEYVGINFSTPKIRIYLPEGTYASLSIKESTGDIEIAEAFKFESVDVSLSTGDVSFFAHASKLIKIKTSTGNIMVKNLSAGALELSTGTGNITASGINCKGDISTQGSTGDVKLDNITCKSLISSGSTGDITLKNVIAADKFLIETSTGDVMFDKCDADEIFVETDTGDVEGSLRSDKVFFVQTDTGDVEVPKTVNGGKCEIITDTGDIEVDVE